MANKERNFVKEMHFQEIARYKKPLIIVMSGIDGCGKELLAKELSRSLKIFLLSNDHVRNYHYAMGKDVSEERRLHIETIVRKQNKYRFIKLLLHRLSFVLDKDVHTKKQYDSFRKISKLFHYRLIKIKVNARDVDNIERILKRVMNLTEKDETIIGDNVSYSAPYPASVYYEIKERKTPNLEGVTFDHEIDNFGTEEDFNRDISCVTNEIKKDLVLKR